MKNNSKIILLSAIVLFTVLIVWFYNREKALQETSVARVSSTNILSAQAAVTSNAAEQQTNTNTSASVATTATLKLPQTNSVTPQEKLNALVENKNALINFWGLVVDQDGNPLEGVKIAGDTRTWYVTPTLNFDSRFPKVSAISDVNGKFEIRNASGDVLAIKSLEKQGYEPEPHALREFGYHTSERFSADPNNPIVFRMWKTNIHEQLIIGQKSFQIVPDGRTYVIDLTRGTITDSGEGDLKIWIKRPDSIIFGQRYDWSCEMDSVSGGLLQEMDVNSSMYLAPADGYVSSFQFEQKVGSGWGDTTGTKRFYIMLNNGQQYGRLSIELFAYYNDHIPGLIRIEYAINPSGSRVLR